jgi:hypothetical protein
MDQVLKLSFLATSAMFGVIWIVQLVHYPMFAGLDRQSFSEWHTFHSNRITFVVAPLMVAELVLSIIVVWMRPNSESLVLCGLTVGVWAATFLWSVPLHNALSAGGGDQAELIRQLVSTNWIRTSLYTLKVALLFKVVTVSW